MLETKHAQNIIFFYFHIWLLRVLNITLAFNDIEKGNKMLMVVFQKKSSPLCMKIIILRQYLWLVLYWRVYINIPSLALNQICENGLFSKERVKHCTVEPLEPLGLHTDTCTDANVLYAHCVFIRKSVLWLPCNGWELVNLRANVGSAQMEWEVVQLAQKTSFNCLYRLL